MKSVPKLTREQAAVVGAFTGYAAGPFSDIHEYAEKKLGRPVLTHEFGDREFSIQLAHATRDDFIALCYGSPEPEDDA